MAYFAEAAPEQFVDGNVPGRLVGVYAVVQAGAAVSDETPSPFTNPAKVGVIAGTADPYGTVALDAVMVRVAGLTMIVRTTADAAA